MPSKPKFSEADVTAQVRSYLEAMGWRAIRMQRTVMKGQFQTGEPGMADCLFLRYPKRGGTGGICAHLWIEFKAPGKLANCICATKKPRQRCTACDQFAWQTEERRRGAVVWQVDDYEQFCARYRLEFGQ